MEIMKNSYDAFLGCLPLWGREEVTLTTNPNYGRSIGILQNENT